MHTGRGKGRAAMRSWMVQARLHKGLLTDGQKQVVKLILSSKDRMVDVQGYAGTGKTTMLNRARALAEKNGYRMIGLAPSAEARIESETLQRFLTRNAGSPRDASRPGARGICAARSPRPAGRSGPREADRIGFRLVTGKEGERK